MESMQIFKLASQQAQWLSVRQSVVAGNIANVNTPGFLAKDVKPFEAVLQSRQSMSATHEMHFKDDGISGANSAEAINGIAVLPSGNSVNLANELSKGSSIKRQYEINTGVVKTMNRMILLTLKK